MESKLLRLPSGELWRCEPNGIKRAFWGVRGDWFHVRSTSWNGGVHFDSFKGEDAEEVSKYLAGIGTDITGQRKATEEVMEHLERERVRAVQQSDKYCVELQDIREWLDKECVQTHGDAGRLTLLERLTRWHHYLQQQLAGWRKRCQDLTECIGQVDRYLTDHGVPVTGHCGCQLTLLERVRRLAEYSWGRKEEDDKIVKAIRAFREYDRKLAGIELRLVLFPDYSGRIETTVCKDCLIRFHDLSRLIQQVEDYLSHQED